MNAKPGTGELAAHPELAKRYGEGTEFTRWTGTDKF